MVHNSRADSKHNRDANDAAPRKKKAAKTATKDVVARSIAAKIKVKIRVNPPHRNVDNTRFHGLAEDWIVKWVRAVYEDELTAFRVNNLVYVGSYIMDRLRSWRGEGEHPREPSRYLRCIRGTWWLVWNKARCADATSLGPQVCMRALNELIRLGLVEAHWERKNPNDAGSTKLAWYGRYTRIVRVRYENK